MKYFCFKLFFTKVCYKQKNATFKDFVCVSPSGDGTVCAQFSQSTKMRSARIVGLEWVASNQILFVTNQASGLLFVFVALV